MPHKLDFNVAQASSEDEGGRAKELLQQAPGVKGWVSSRFCIYPQELIFQLTERCHLTRVQILAHQHLIPEKVELYIGDVGPGREETLYNAKFAQLGYITFSDNEHSQFKARELKSVTVDCTGTFLKIVLHKNHINRINLYNQIGIVAISILGNEVEDNNNSVSPDGEGGQVPSSREQEVPLYHDLAFAMYVDTQAASTIRNLEDRRTAAQRENRYEYANKLKDAVTQLRKAGERLGKYEIEKRHAIENENFDRAKLKKQLAEEYREQVYKALHIEDLLERKGKLDRNDVPGPKGLCELPPPPRSKNKPVSRDPSPTHAQTKPTHLPPARTANTPPKPPPSPPKSPSPPPIKVPSAPLPDLRQTQQPLKTPLPPSSPRHGQLPGPPAAPSPAPYTTPSSAYVNYDEQTLPALKHRDVLERTAEEPNCSGGRRPLGLAEVDRKDAALPIDVFGTEVVEKIYSKNYAEKESGLKHLQSEMTRYSIESSGGVRPDKFVRASGILIRKALKDKVYSVALLASHTLSQLLNEFFCKHKVSRKEITSTFDKVLPDLLAKTSDNASRTQSLAVKTILEMLVLSLERGVGGVGIEVTRPLTNTVHPRGSLCRANIVETQLTMMGPTALPKDRDSGFTPRHLVEFAHSAFRHQSNEVRKVGERLLLTLYTHYPSTVRKALPLHDELARKNVLYRNLFEQLEAIDEKRETGPRTPRPSPSQASGPQSTPNHSSSNTTPTHSSTPSSSSGVSSGGSISSAGGYPLVPQISITPDEAEVRGRALSRLNGSSADLKSMDEDLHSPSDPEEKTCIFCGAYDSSFTESGLDMHYWRACPMLTRCQHCRQVVEVASLTQHLLGECVSSSQYRRCERCSEAIPKNSFHTHALAKTCTPCKPEPIANHCPLCHENIPPWEDGWKTHLMPGPESCPANSRAKPSAASKKGGQGEKSPPANSGMAGGPTTTTGGPVISAAAAVKSRIPASSTPGTPRRNNTNRRR